MNQIRGPPPGIRPHRANQPDRPGNGGGGGGGIGIVGPPAGIRPHRANQPDRPGDGGGGGGGGIGIVGPPAGIRPHRANQPGGPGNGGGGGIGIVGPPAGIIPHRANEPEPPRPAPIPPRPAPIPPHPAPIPPRPAPGPVVPPPQPVPQAPLSSIDNIEYVKALVAERISLYRRGISRYYGRYGQGGERPEFIAFDRYFDNIVSRLEGDGYNNARLKLNYILESAIEEEQKKEKREESDAIMRQLYSGIISLFLGMSAARGSYNLLSFSDVPSFIVFIVTFFIAHSNIEPAMKSFNNWSKRKGGSRSTKKHHNNLRGGQRTKARNAHTRRNQLRFENTIEGVKAKLQEKEGLPPNQSRLIFQGIKNSSSSVMPSEAHSNRLPPIEPTTPFQINLIKANANQRIQILFETYIKYLPRHIQVRLLSGLFTAFMMSNSLTLNVEQALANKDLETAENLLQQSSQEVITMTQTILNELGLNIHITPEAVKKAGRPFLELYLSFNTDAERAKLLSDFDTKLIKLNKEQLTKLAKYLKAPKAKTNPFNSL